MFRDILLVLALLATSGATTDVIVWTSGGRVRGAVEMTGGKPVARFLGVPYAKPPVRSLRFRPPEPAEPWEDVLDARQFPAACAQANGSFPPVPWLVDKRLLSEDCLFLNIWSPQTGGKPKAILMWIHGGGFRTGTSSAELYDAKLLAAVGDIVVVSVAHRLGSFGFLYTGQDSSPGNYALLDQELAMHWMRDNAAVFGADGSAITLYGESAGSICTGLHLLAQRNAHIVHRAIMASGSPYWLAPPQNDVGHALAKILANAVGCRADDEDWGAVVGCLRRAPVEAVMHAEDTAFPNELVTFTPAFGDSYLPRRFAETIRDGRLIPIDALMTGVTSHEGSVFLYVKDPDRFNTREGPVGLTRSEAAAFAGRHYFAALPAAVQSVISSYFQGNVQGSGGILGSLIDSVGDFLLVCPTKYFAEAYARLNYPVYFYVFDHRSAKSYWPPWMGTAHFEELQYVFGMPFRFPERYTELDRNQSMLAMRLFTAFVRTGRPQLPDGSQWPVFTKEQPYHVTLHAGEASVGKAFHEHGCRLFRTAYLLLALMKP